MLAGTYFDVSVCLYDKNTFFHTKQTKSLFSKDEVVLKLNERVFFFFTQTSQYFWFDGCYVVINGILCEHKTVAISWTEEVCGLT